MRRSQWLALKPGDVLISKRGDLRPVLRVHVHPKAKNMKHPRMFVTLRKIQRRDWTPGPTTTYLFSDAVHMGLRTTNRHFVERP